MGEGAGKCGTREGDPPLPGFCLRGVETSKGRLQAEGGRLAELQNFGRWELNRAREQQGGGLRLGKEESEGDRGRRRGRSAEHSDRLGVMQGRTRSKGFGRRRSIVDCNVRSRMSGIGGFLPNCYPRMSDPIAHGSMTGEAGRGR
jgi:hypothetical protein